MSQSKRYQDSVSQSEFKGVGEQRMIPAPTALSTEEDISESSDDEENKSEEEVDNSQKVSFFGTICNQILLNLGAGILSMPKYMAAAGVVNALGIMAFSFCVNYVAVMALVHAAEKYKVFEMEMLVEKLRRGHVWSRVCWWGVMISFGLVLMCYMASFRDAVAKTEEIVRLYLDTNSPLEKVLPTDEQFPSTWAFDESLLRWQAKDFLDSSEVFFTNAKGMMLCVFCVLPLCFFPMRWLSVTSFLATVINIGILAVILVNFYFYHRDQSFPNGHPKGEWVAFNDICVFSLDPIGNIGFMSTMMMAICVQPCLIPMYEEMEDRSPARFAKTLKISSLFCFLLFAIFSIAAYATFGNDTHSNILRNLPRDAYYSLATQVGVVIVMATAYPLMLLPMVSGIKQKWLKNAAIVGVVFASFLVAMAFADVDLDTLNNLAGASGAFFFLALFPALVALQLLSREYFGVIEDGENEEAEQLLPASAQQGYENLPGSLYCVGNGVKKTFWYGLIAFGVAVMVLGTIYPSAPLVPGKWLSEDKLSSTWTSLDILKELPQGYSEKRAKALPVLPAYLEAVSNALAMGERPTDIPQNEKNDVPQDEQWCAFLGTEKKLERTDVCPTPLKREFFFRYVSKAEYKEGLIIDVPMNTWEALTSKYVWDALMGRNVYKREPVSKEEGEGLCFADSNEKGTITGTTKIQAQLDPVTRALVISKMIEAVRENMTTNAAVPAGFDWTIANIEAIWKKMKTSDTVEGSNVVKEIMHFRIDRAFLKKVYDAETSQNKEEVCAVKLANLIN